MFKQKNKKVSHIDTRITLDAKHNEIIRSFKEDQKNIKNIKQTYQMSRRNSIS